MTVPLASVLLVDDGPDVLLTLDMVLEKAGYTVTTATDAAHALHLAAENDFHVAVVGYRLHGSSMHGLQLITRLHDANPFTVPLLITDHDKGEVGFRAAQVGAFSYLTKPFSDKALLDAVRAALDEHLRREQMRDRLHVGAPSTRKLDFGENELSSIPGPHIVVQRTCKSQYVVVKFTITEIRQSPVEKQSHIENSAFLHLGKIGGKA
jgi:DNA-binding NtrC family response regulator